MHEIIIRHDDDDIKDNNAVYLLSIPHTVKPLHLPEELLDFLQLLSLLLRYKKGKGGKSWLVLTKKVVELNYEEFFFWMYKLSYNHNT